MKKMLEGCKELEFAETAVQIKSALSEQSKEQISTLAKELLKK